MKVWRERFRLRDVLVPFSQIDVRYFGRPYILMRVRKVRVVLAILEGNSEFLLLARRIQERTL